MKTEELPSMVGQCSMGPWPHNWYPWTPSQLAGDIFCPEKPLALGRLPSLSQDRAINQAQKKEFLEESVILRLLITWSHSKNPRNYFPSFLHIIIDLDDGTTFLSK